MIRVLIADDHAVVREGIKRIITDAGDMTVAAEAADGPGLLDALAETLCDVVLVDLSMPGVRGLELLKQVRDCYPELPLLVLSMYPADQYAVRAIIAGASGYVNKAQPPTELVIAIRTVVSGRRHITPEVAELLALHLDRASARLPHQLLSNREYEVLCLIASGKSVSDIAAELALSVKTVSTYRTRILEKLHLRHNAEITRYALEHGLVQ
jgi:DNA-binding NarL/FixJ family response regulator